MGILFVGNPDSVYRQIMDFHDKVGGFNHLSMIGRSGFMTHRELEKGIRLFSKEVLAAAEGDQAGRGGVTKGRGRLSPVSSVTSRFSEAQRAR